MPKPRAVLTLVFLDSIYEEYLPYALALEAKAIQLSACQLYRKLEVDQVLETACCAATSRSPHRIPLLAEHIRSKTYKEELAGYR